MLIIYVFNDSCNIINALNTAQIPINFATFVTLQKQSYFANITHLPRLIGFLMMPHKYWLVVFYMYIITSGYW